MKVSIIGGTGFVGSYIIDELIANDHIPRLLVRKGSEYKVIQSEKCEIISGDIDDENAIKETLTGCDAIIYLIALIREFPAKKLTNERNLAVILITHDMGVIAETTNRVAVMKNGNLVELGTTKPVSYTHLTLPTIYSV